MFILKPDRKHGSKVSYMGVDWRGSLYPPPVKPNDSLMFCDLGGCILDGLDLSLVEFFGCRLNGTSFQGATLQKTKIIGCFSSHRLTPTDFRNCFWEDVIVKGSHLNYISDQSLPDYWHWPVEATEIASDTLSERNDVRYYAAVKLGALGNPIVVPILACLLTDNEWDVRSIALESLGKLHHKKFPHRNKVLLEWMFLCLGDKHFIVRQMAGELVKALLPPDNVLLVSIERMKSHSSEKQLAGLRAVNELCKLNIAYSHLVNLKILKSLLSSGVSKVRCESIHLLGILDNPSTTSWLLSGLSDPVSSVRVAVLSAIKLLTKPPPADSLIPLLNDPDENVRIEVMYTLGQIGDFYPQNVELALSDPSTEVRRLAQILLEGR